MTQREANDSAPMDWFGENRWPGFPMDFPMFYHALWIHGHCLRRYLTLQIIVNYTPVPLPKKIRLDPMGHGVFL